MLHLLFLLLPLTWAADADAASVSVEAVVEGWEPSAMSDHLEDGCIFYDAAVVRVTAPAAQAGTVLRVHVPSGAPVAEVAVWQTPGVALCFTMAVADLTAGADTQLFVGAAQGVHRCLAP